LYCLPSLPSPLFPSPLLSLLSVVLFSPFSSLLSLLLFSHTTPSFLTTPSFSLPLSIPLSFPSNLLNFSFPLQQFLAQQHAREVLEVEVENLMKQITLRDEFLDVRKNIQYSGS
jgi:hypothetical protein